MNKGVVTTLLILFLPALAHAALRDPTKPLGSDEIRNIEPALLLQAIFITNDTRYVVINNRSLHLGQKLNGWTVKRISRKKVWLERQGQSKELALRSSISSVK